MRAEGARGSVSGCIAIVYLGLGNRGVAKIMRIGIKYKIPAAQYSRGTSEAGLQSCMACCPPHQVINCSVVPIFYL